MGKHKKNSSKKTFDPKVFEDKLSNLMGSLKSWGEDGYTEDSLEAVWSAYLEFRKPYKKFVCLEPEPGETMEGLFDSIGEFLAQASKYKADPDKYFPF